MKATDRFDSLFQFYGEKNAIDWLLLKAQVQAESNFNPDARSRVGAKGLSQFMDRTWEEWRDGIPGIQPPPIDLVSLNPFDPEDAIRSQAAMMSWLLSILKDVDQALAAYNWGIGRVLKVRKSRGDWKQKLPDETKNYITRITARRARYAEEFERALTGSANLKR